MWHKDGEVWHEVDEVCVHCECVQQLAESVVIEFEHNSVTDEDGRCSNLLLASLKLRPGTYKVHFDTGTYFSSCSSDEPFYPYADVSILKMFVVCAISKIVCLTMHGCLTKLSFARMSVSIYLLYRNIGEYILKHCTSM